MRPYLLHPSCRHSHNLLSLVITSTICFVIREKIKQKVKKDDKWIFFSFQIFTNHDEHLRIRDSDVSIMRSVLSPSVKKITTRKCSFPDTSIAGVSTNAAKIDFYRRFWKNVAKETIFTRESMPTFFEKHYHRYFAMFLKR